MRATIAELPAFTIERIEEREGEDALFVGRFTHLRGVRERGWLLADSHSLPARVESLDAESGAATLAVGWWTVDHPIQVGGSIPWLDAYWQPYHLEMMLDEARQWERVSFEPTPAQFFLMPNGVRGWAPVGSRLPEGATPSHIDEVGWDHEHCTLCFGKIGAGGSEYGYVSEPFNRWLCPSCYGAYALPRSIAFAVAQQEPGTADQESES